MKKTLLEKMTGTMRGVAMATVLVTLSGVQSAFAADPAHGADHGGGSAGLPQFDPSSFSSQIFWMLVTFAVLYLVFARRVLPQISSVLENRNEHITSDRDTARRIKEEAEAVQSAYESGLNNARAESERINTETDAQIKNNLNAALDAVRAKTDREITALDERLNTAKASAMDEMNGIAAEVAAAAAKKIVGIETNIDQAKTVVNKLSEAA